MSKSTEGINFSLSAGRSRKPSKLNTITLEKVFAWIEKKGLDEPVVKELKKMASVYPQAALENWMKNYQMHLVKARDIISKRQKIEIMELEDSVIEELVEKDLQSIDIDTAPVTDEF